ncbi:hypothetical protein F5Y06DRAFT_287068 [Hypoxylon sp. FL0890]|nr:hypothetical protein F5Y06DRAFT_287068 [Hypoxylon sp. FL0890]
MTGIASTELFKMRIPSPDPELSGEALAKEVPNDPNRTGTIYADQFLAHKCPPNFDDLQRRQFFCILDLRRLKYAADEIFVKKDWKLNIMNFAKEYEKSRGLIMLRYGLYEFKNVKPSEEVLKKWRATHNLPDPEPESERAGAVTPVPNNRRTGVPGTSTKRKAEEELAPKDNALMASTANQNKRRNVAQEQVDLALTGPAPFKKSKRKADETEEPDENQPNKVQKPTPSAAKSKFESILNRAQNGSGTPLKRAPLASFGAQRSSESQNSNLTSKLNPFATSNAMIFGAGTNGTQTNGGESKKPEIQFGSSTAGASTTPFTFSQGSSGSGFTFTAGGNGQSFNNPFASSSAPSPAPIFGNKSSTPAPASSSFNFSFGQQGPSTPNPAPASQGNSLFGASSNAGNGAPSFSFTGATPPQNNSNPFAPKPMPGNTGSFLQASGDASTRASTYFLDKHNCHDYTNMLSGSPFPAPSSLGTTPISGTPEPQSQGEDGEEGPQAQISLTAANEENETILHEVRAKAIKYIPIVKGSDEEDERKSPWSTQGVGTLRVLKHDHTGIVRVLLRAEPRGHVAMNKALLSDVEYKSKDKTVNFVAASDDGSGLETWVLQVKKPDMAQQLAGVLEEHKSANKK